MENNDFAYWICLFVKNDNFAQSYFMIFQINLLFFQMYLFCLGEFMFISKVWISLRECFSF